MMFGGDYVGGAASALIVRFAGIVSVAGVAALASGCGSITAKEDSGVAPVDAPGGGIGGGDGGTIDAAPALDATPPDPCTGNVAFEDFFGCLVSEVCDLFTNCACLVADQDGCDKLPLTFYGSLDRAYAEEFLRDAMADGTITYDAAKAGTCIDTLRNLQCANLFDSNNVFDDVCKPFVGTVQSGGVCFGSVECADAGADCDNNGCDGDQCCAGACVAPVPVDGDCTNNRNCVIDAHCVRSAAGDRICSAGELGDFCNGSSDCDSDHYCDSLNRCRVDRPTNSACTDDSECAAGEECIGDDLPGLAGQCGPVTVVGQSCDGRCIGCLYCEQADNTVAGTCRELPGAGASCADSDRCKGSLQLTCSDTSVCETRGGALGTLCSTTNECKYGLFCSTEVAGGNSGTCMAPQGANAACTRDTQCSSSICAGAATKVCQDYADCRPN